MQRQVLQEQQASGQQVRPALQLPEREPEQQALLRELPEQPVPEQQELAPERRALPPGLRPVRAPESEPQVSLPERQGQPEPELPEQRALQQVLQEPQALQSLPERA